MSAGLLAALVVRALRETRGPLFFLRKPDGHFVFGWGAKEQSRDLGLAKDNSCWVGAKSFFSGFHVNPPSLKPAKVDVWKDFPDALFFSPRFLVEGNAADGSFIFHDDASTPAEDEAWKRFFEETEQRFKGGAADEGSLELSAVLSPLAEQEWDDLCRSGEAALQRGELRKFVPARKKTFLSEGKLDPGAVFQRLWKSAGADNHLFVIRNNEDVFCGLSPERLFAAQSLGGDAGFQVETMALAGTRARGKDSAEDAKLAAELLASEKERLEHQVVVDFIEKRLSALGAMEAKPASPEVMKLKTLQHLRTPMKARVKNFTRVLSLLDTLHPTPAVGGDPQEAALELLCRHELWERGYFAAPLGFTFPSRGEAYFIVALRSLLIQGDKAHFFAGAGYVNGSTIQGEWEETRKKIEATLTALGAEA